MSNGDLSVTALYTCGVWAWAELPGADLLDHKDARRVYGATSAALSIAARGAPSLKHGLVQRHLMIDRLVEESGARRVLELGAGLSPRGVALSAKGIEVIEVDMPAVIAKKRELLERTDAGRAALARLTLLEGDLMTIELPDADVVVAEGVLMYLEPDPQRALFARVNALLSSARAGVAPAGERSRSALAATPRAPGFFFDLVPPAEQPPPGAAGRALGWMMRRFTKGADFARAPRTRAEITTDLEQAGFAVTTFDPIDAPARWALPHRKLPTQQLVWAATPK
jgi:O-methyltransferase involved in polyketide biosynthesis